MTDSENSKRIRVLLVDDQTLFVESLRLVIDMRAPDMTVVGVAHDGQEALELIDRLTPDVILMDVRMPNMDGVEATKVLHQRHPGIRVLMLTTFDEDRYVHEAFNHGACGYLLKDMSPSNLIGAIRAAQAGGGYMSPSLATRLAGKANSGTEDDMPGSGNDPAGMPTDLSRRDREVLLLVAEGLDNKEIAQRLNIAEQTVKNRVSELYFKLQIPDRLHLIRLAKSRGWGSSDTAL